MNRLIRIELFKLSTIRTTYGLALAGAAITALFASLEASGAGHRVARISTAAGQSTVSTATGIAMVLAAVLGVIAASGEYRHTTATLTYLATPDRNRVLAAKSIATAIAGLGYGILAGLVSTGTALVFVATRHDHVLVGTGTLILHILGAGLGAALLAAIGVAVGSLIRSQIAGVVGVLVWCMVIESILGGSISAIRPYLPYAAASTLGGAKLGAAAFGPGYTVSGQQALSFIAATALIAALAGLFAVVAARTTVRQDIT
jgi:ABC-type transport system involved in multi-copper enzyme maturation permease subunit